MVIIEFVEIVQIEGSGMAETRKIYFVGQSIEDVLADTQNGTKFAIPSKLSPPRQISVDEARALNLDGLENGMSAVISGAAKSFYLGALKQLRGDGRST